MTDIERLAKVAFDAYTKRCSQTGALMATWDGLGPFLQGAWIDGIRAVLTALREPSEEMLRAAEIPGMADINGKRYLSGTGCWRAMINYLLGETADGDG